MRYTAVYAFLGFIYMSRDSAVSIATGYRLDGQWVGVPESL
jgi:hypothetical protein